MVGSKNKRIKKKTDLGPDILFYLLKKEGVKVSSSGIGKLLKREGLSRQRKRIKKKEKWIKRITTYPSELVEIDVIYVKKFKGNWLYQYTVCR